MTDLSKAKEALKQSRERGKSKRTEYRNKQKERQRTANMEVIWAPQYKDDGSPGPQVALLTCPIPEILFGGARGGGKSLPLDELVMTPSGYAPMGSLSVGDEVCGPSGEVTKVVGVFPQGVEDVYRVTLADGRTVRASSDHLWLVRTMRGDVTISTSEMIMRLDRGATLLLPVDTLAEWVPVSTIRHAGQAETQCIKVGRADGLFITNDGVITHNTDAALGAWMMHANKYGSYAKGMFIRRQFKQLEEVQNRCTMLFPKLGASYIKGEALWQFQNGATLKLRHLWDDADADSYQGHQYNFLVLEELTQWPTPGPMDKMRATLRSAHGVECKIICTANPGGTGHLWVKNRYITPAPKGYTPIKDPETGSYRVYIPSRLQDNKALWKNDPQYEQRLLASGNPALVRAWLHGDWDSLAGGFFDDIFNADKHLVRPFNIPSTWRWRRSFDWGSAAPSSLGIWAISDGTPIQEMDGFVFPRGSLIRVDEWYTVAYKNGQIDPNKGLRLTNLALGAGIANRANGRNFSGCVADPAIFSEHGRQSIFSEMQIGAREMGHHLLFNRADNNRVAGWQKVRDMLENAANDHPEKPGLWSFDTCIHFARTMPVLQRDDKKPDDIDTDQEDHVADEVRYACMTGGRGVVEGSITGH